MKDKILLVYSGGLDTTVCIPMMREDYGYKDVVTVTIDVGQDPADIEQAEEKAQSMKTEHYTIDAKEEFAEKFCWPAVQANGDYQGYPMSTSIARPLIAANRRRRRARSSGSQTSRTAAPARATINTESSSAFAL